MTSSLDELTRKFIDFSVTSAPGPALDVGAAYGVATLEVLGRRGKVIANDIEARHLEILRNRTPKGQLANLVLAPGRFPEELKLAEKSIGAVLISRVLHFFPAQPLKKLPRRFFNGSQAAEKYLSPRRRLTYATFRHSFLSTKDARARVILGRDL